MDGLEVQSSAGERSDGEHPAGMFRNLSIDTNQFRN